MKKSVQYISRNYTLCSKHFGDSQFMNPAMKERGLMWKAVPTIFTVPNPPPKESTEQPLHTQREVPQEEEPPRKKSRKGKKTEGKLFAYNFSNLTTCLE